MALAIAQYQTSPTSQKLWLQKVVELAPDWSWTHYARALLAIDKEPETAVAEFNKYIAADGSWISAYSTLIYVQEKTLKRFDDAIATAEKAVVRPEACSWNFLSLWRLRLGKAGGTNEAKEILRKEFERLAADLRNLQVLDAVRLAYSSLLTDQEKSKSIEAKIRRIDSGWYPERGRIIYISAKNANGIPRTIVAANRQFSLYYNIEQLSGEMEPDEKIAGLENLLALSPSAEMKRYLYERLFQAAEKAGKVGALIKYGDLLYTIDPSDHAIPAKIALALANKKETQKALYYARIAERATTLFHPAGRPANSGFTADEWVKEQYSEKRQRQSYENLRSLALAALGWSLSQAGRNNEAEIYLKKSVETTNSEQNLFHFAEVLGRLGRSEESEQILAQAKTAYADALKKTFRNEFAQDFELSTIEGRKVKLSDLKGKVVILDFWATWCGPCLKSMPTLNRLYEKYKERGLEILYISVDEQADLYKVAPTAKANKLAFPILFDAGAKAMYDVKVFPTTIFIDREGKIRYRNTGFTEESERMLETVAELLLKTNETVGSNDLIFANSY